MKTFHVMLFVVLTLFAFTNSAFAASLDEAKRDGYIGEQLDGYLGLVDPAAPPAVQAIVTDINAKRKAEYTQIAQKNGTTISAVEVLAAQKAIGQTPKGQFVQTSSGSWTKK